MNERNHFGSIAGLALSIREARKDVPAEADAWRKGYVLLVRKDNGAIVGMVQSDDLFDENGNRFSFD